MTGRRPRVSERGEERGEASRAKSEVLEVMRDLERVVRGKEAGRCSRVEEMMPVS